MKFDVYFLGLSLSNLDHTFYGFTGVITHLGCWEKTKKLVNHEPKASDLITRTGSGVPFLGERKSWCTGKEKEKRTQDQRLVNLQLQLTNHIMICVACQNILVSQLRSCHNKTL